MSLQSFAMELADGWSRWVLEHGLPELPDRLRDGESVPVSWWIGPDTAAVLHLRRWGADQGEDAYTEIDVQLFGRIDGKWEPGPGGGAGGWADPALVAVDVAAEHADLSGAAGGSDGERSLIALWGEVGTAAATVEVEQDGVTISRPVVGPLGWVVVSGAIGSPYTARVRDAAGRVLSEQTAPPAGW